jgi:transposase
MIVYLGIDWSQAKHDACFVNEKGVVITSLTIPHSVEGLQKLDSTREKLGVAAAECWVGLETAHNLVIDYLWARNYSQVYVIPPNAVKSARPRYRQSGAHHDLSDAYVIGDMLRTDQARLQPWHPNSELVQQMRAKVSLVMYLTQEKTRASNRLTAVLSRYYPAALRVFSRPMPEITWHLICAYPTPEAAQTLTWTDFEAFARQHHYRQREIKLRASFARLQAPQPPAAPAVVAAYQDEAVLLAQQLLRWSQIKIEQTKELDRLFNQHIDADLFRSLPGTGPFLAPGLLCKFGDDRRRFPSPLGLQCLAGTCPVTLQSGQRRTVKFRKACDHEFRAITQQWALTSLDKSTWAAEYWERVRPQCNSDSHAYRCLANRWLAIGWRVWQDRRPYDEAYHLQRRAQRQQPRAAK